MIETNINLLRQVSKKTTLAEVKQIELERQLCTANDYAWTKGAGLAAIQIGIPLRFAWYKIGTKEYTLLNPEIIETEGRVRGTEGCLSIPNQWFQTERYKRIVVKSGEVTFAAEGFEAWLICHEIDHMNGILVMDRQFDPYPKLGRNDLCGCGSGVKYKKCHLL